MVENSIHTKYKFDFCLTPRHSGGLSVFSRNEVNVKRLSQFVTALVFTCVLTSSLFAQTTEQSMAQMRQEMQQMQRQLQAQNAQIAKLQQANGQNWLNEQRAAEVKSLVQEVLADADTRASLLESGLSAGHNGKSFFLASEDGSFALNLAGHFQFRHIWNSQDNAADEDDTGFQFRRMKVKFKGHVGNPKITYGITLIGSGSSGSVSAEGPFMGYNFGNGWDVKFGLIKIPFLRQELISSSKQMAVDRGLVTEFFTMDYSEMVQLNYKGENLRASFSINDGVDEEFSTIGADYVEVAFSARVDLKLAGDWKQWSDTSTWSKDELGLFVGGAVHYQTGDAHNVDAAVAKHAADYLAWTVDGSLESNGLGLFIAYMGGNIAYDEATTPDQTMQGLLVEAGYMIIPDKLEPFVRWEYLDYDSVTLNELQAVTVGFNWYIRGHNAKFSTDLIWVYDGDVVANNFGNDPGTSNLGMTGSGSSANNDDIFVLRSQFQLLF
ncbi:MAG TPA: hypothetical protein DCM28_11855 [Phycisphaerales bacterium]|nr:hypothetical protein [Phycisphaerales bacterium]